jgi:hypothetical protein
MSILLRYFLNKQTQQFNKIYPHVKSWKKFSSSAVNLAKFDFVVSKFNDIHIKEKNVIEFFQQANSNKEIFENTLKSNF